MIRIFGALDISASLLFGIIYFGFGSWRIPLIITFYVITKCAMFRKDLWSWVDVGMGLSAWFFLFNPSLLVLIPIIYFLQKGILSFF